MLDESRVHLGRLGEGDDEEKGERQPFYKYLLGLVCDGLISVALWTRGEIGRGGERKIEGKQPWEGQREGRQRTKRGQREHGDLLSGRDRNAM